MRATCCPPAVRRLAIQARVHAVAARKHFAALRKEARKETSGRRRTSKERRYRGPRQRGHFSSDIVTNSLSGVINLPMFIGHKLKVFIARSSVRMATPDMRGLEPDRL